MHDDEDEDDDWVLLSITTWLTTIIVMKELDVGRRMRSFGNYVAMMRGFEGVCSVVVGQY
jgi:hypothetical protein